MSTRSIIIIATAAMAALLEIIDSSIVNVAVPTMMGNLGVTLDQVSWVSTAYMIANSIVLPIAAWLGMRLGRRTYFTTAILCFTAASFMCGVAPNLPVLILFRILQGLAGGALLPTSQTLIQEQFPPEKAGMASAIFGMSIMIGPALGPTLGGYLTDNYGWRSIFNINVPLGLVAALLSYLNIKNNKDVTSNSDPRAKSKVDVIGLMLLCIGVGCIQYILERGEADDWWASNVIRTCSVFGVAGTLTFIWWELKTPFPIMNLRLFKENAVRSGTLLMLMLGVMVYALTFVVPIFVSRVLFLTATQTGELFIPGAIFTAFTMLLVGASMKWIHPKILVLVGMVIAEAALMMMSRFSTDTSSQGLYTALILRGVATGFLFIPINGMVLGQFTGERLGQVSGMMNFFRQIGGSIGIASLSTLLTRFGAQNYADLMGKVNALNLVAVHDFFLSRGAAVSKFSSAIGLASNRAIAFAQLSMRANQQVFVLSFSQLCWVIMFIFSLALIPLYLIKTQSRIGKVQIDH